MPNSFFQSILSRISGLLAKWKESLSKRKGLNLNIFPSVCLEALSRISKTFNRDFKQIFPVYEAEFPTIRSRPLMKAYSLYGTGLHHYHCEAADCHCFVSIHVYSKSSPTRKHLFSHPISVGQT